MLHTGFTVYTQTRKKTALLKRRSLKRDTGYFYRKTNGNFMSEFDGRIWAVQDADGLTLVCQKQTIRKKIQIINEKGREQSLSEDKLLLNLSSKARTLGEWPETLEQVKARLADLQAEVDVELLWETAVEMETSDLAELAELFFDEKSSEHQMAIWQALAADGTYFKRRGKLWELRSKEQIEELRTHRQREEEKAQFQAIAEDWLTKAATAQPSPLRQAQDGTGSGSEEVEPEAEAFVARLESWMRGDKDKDAQVLIEKIAEANHVQPRELIFDILQKVGRIPEDADRDVIVAGLKPDFSQSMLDAAEAIPLWVPDPAKPIHSLAFSIDDDDTREVDDALNIEADGDGWRIDIGIADPACAINKDDNLDREAMRRGTTVYLPTQTILMIPPRISTDIASLNQGEPRSAVMIQVWLDADAKVKDFSISREAAQVENRLNYAQADAALASATDTPSASSGEGVAQRLQNLKAMTDKLREQRMAEGALSFNRPEYKMKVKDGIVSVEMIERDSPSRAIVAELMILANHLAGKYAQRHQVPLIFRTQDPPEQPISLEDQQDSVRFQKVRRWLKPSALSLQPGAHSGLGLGVYTQFSSPLRRFADLVMQRQLDAHLNGETLPYDQEELFKVLATAEQTAREAKSLEIEAKKRWFVVYLKQRQEQGQGNALTALVLDAVKGGYKVELQPWGTEAFMSGGNGLQAGDKVTAQIDKLRPKAGQIRLRFAEKL